MPSCPCHVSQSYDGDCESETECWSPKTSISACMPALSYEKAALQSSRFGIAVCELCSLRGDMCAEEKEESKVCARLFALSEAHLTFPGLIPMLDWTLLRRAMFPLRSLDITLKRMPSLREHRWLRHIKAIIENHRWLPHLPWTATPLRTRPPFDQWNPGTLQETVTLPKRTICRLKSGGIRISMIRMRL